MIYYKRCLAPGDNPGTGAEKTDKPARKEEQEAVQKKASHPGSEENAAGKKGATFNEESTAENNHSTEPEDGKI